MTPETEQFLAKARELLVKAQNVLDTFHWTEDAGRAAYLAGFHAAQALISERTGRSVKTHNGVNTEFHRLVRGDPRVDDKLRGFLGFAYNLKAIADYETGPDSEVSEEMAIDAIESARRFLAKMVELIESGVSGASDA